MSKSFSRHPVVAVGLWLFGGAAARESDRFCLDAFVAVRVVRAAVYIIV